MTHRSPSTGLQRMTITVPGGPAAWKSLNTTLPPVPVVTTPTSTAVTASSATLGGNVTTLELHGTFDDCQAIVKRALADDEIQMEGLVASVDGKMIIRDAIRGKAAEAQALGTQLAERLLSRGADKILRAIYGTA